MPAHVITPHQSKALRYATSRDVIALFMEMRLGKSLVAIRWAQQLRAPRVLLVSPLTTLLGTLNWQGELSREGIEPTMLPSIAREKRMSAIRPARIRHGVFRRAWARGWFCVNYEALRTQPELLHAPWDVIILDESTRIRSPKAQITKVLIKHTQHIEHRAILTGLPNPESEADYFSQFKFLHGSFLGFDNFWSFRQKLFYQGYSQWDWRASRKTRERIRAYVHEHAFVLTRKQAGVGSRKIRQQRNVELNGAQRRCLRDMRTKFEVDGVETQWATVVNTWAQRIAGGFHPITKEIISDRKIRLAEELIVDEFKHEPLVMWFRFNAEMHYLKEWLRKRHRKLTIDIVDGTVKKTERPKLQERFQSGRSQIIMLQVKLGRFGWNLSRSSTSLYYSNSYEFEDRSQSEDRIIHLKKKDDCLYLDLVTLGTPDSDLVSTLSHKRMTARLFSMQMRQSVARLLKVA